MNAAVESAPQAAQPVLAKTGTRLSGNHPSPFFRNLLSVALLLLWLGFGVLMTWLLADFNRDFNHPVSFVPPWLVMSLFFGSAAVIGWFRISKSLIKKTLSYPINRFEQDSPFCFTTQSPPRPTSNQHRTLPEESALPAVHARN